jgi:frataxin-like iron-binding protein CyaY
MVCAGIPLRVRPGCGGVEAEPPSLSAGLGIRRVKRRRIDGGKRAAHKSVFLGPLFLFVATTQPHPRAMRRCAVVTLLQLSRSRAAAACAADAAFLPRACTAAGRIDAASTSTTPTAAAACRLASTARGLACPPHGGGGGSGRTASGGAATSATTDNSSHAHDPAAEAAYHAAADDALHALLDGLEAWVDDTPGLADVDVEYSVSVGGGDGGGRVSLTSFFFQALSHPPYTHTPFPQQSGVLTLSLGAGRGTYVLNKQAPNRQLWLSSPVR